MHSSAAATGTATSGAGAGTQLSATDRAFVMEAAGSGMYEVEVSRLAVNRATNPQVKQYAQMLVTHHTQANSELMALAQSRGIAPPPTLPADKAAKLNSLQLQSGAQFDRQYVQQVGLQDHQTDIALFERASRDANDAALKAWAAKTLPTLRSHLQAAQNLAGQMAG
jgi:putative membrane protein